MIIKQPDYPPWNGSPAYRAPSVVTDFIVHHGAGPRDESPLAIDAQHRSQGWVGIGYTWVIGEDGTIYQGRPINMVPAAAEDYNTASVDVCLTGNFQSDDPGYTGPPTSAQMQSLYALCVDAHQQIPSIERIIGHRDVAGMENDPSVATACPGDKLYEQLPALRDHTAAALQK